MGEQDHRGNRGGAHMTDRIVIIGLCLAAVILAVSALL